MLTIKDIVELLVQKHQLDAHSAEVFMNAVVETIHEGLKNDRVVKIKGFGTFKLTAVRERESINVNTGERVVISSHDKVSFTPDAVMRDLVNKPFAQFDTVVLADGVDFEDMPDMDADDENNVDSSVETMDYTPANVPVEEKVSAPVEVPAESPVETPAEEPIEEPVAEPAVEPVVAPVVESVVAPVVEPEVESVKEPEVVAPVAEAKSESVQMPVPEPEVEEVKEDIVEPIAEAETEVEQISEPESVVEPEPEKVDALVSEPVVEEPAVEESSVEEPAVEESSAEAEQPVIEQAKPVTQPEPEPEEEEEEEETSYYDEDDEISECKKLFIMYAIIVNVIVAALFFILGYYAHSSNLLGIEPDKTSAVETPAEPVVETPATKPAEATPVKAEEKAVEEQKEEAAKNQQEATKEEKPAEVKAPVAEPKKDVKPEVKAEAPSKYDSDPRVRTGAYRIVGTATIVTVKAGQTIKGISKTYLGAGMECYVEAYNGGITELKEGQKIKIPKLELKKKAKK